MTSTARSVFIGGLLLSAFALQQTPFVLRGDYSRQLAWKGASPDARYRVEIRRQATFPAFDILDPSGTAHFAVIDERSGTTTATAKEELGEIFDLQRPKVVWSATHVEVHKFDRSRPEAIVRLPLNR